MERMKGDENGFHGRPAVKPGILPGGKTLRLSRPLAFYRIVEDLSSSLATGRAPSTAGETPPLPITKKPRNDSARNLERAASPLRLGTCYFSGLSRTSRIRRTRVAAR